MRLAKSLVIAAALIWLFLLGQNVFLHFAYGWGDDTATRLFGLIPLLGLASPFLVFRLSQGQRKWTANFVAFFSLLMAGLYLFIVEQPSYIN